MSTKFTTKNNLFSADHWNLTPASRDITNFEKKETTRTTGTLEAGRSADGEDNVTAMAAGDGDATTGGGGAGRGYVEGAEEEEEEAWAAATDQNVWGSCGGSFEGRFEG